MKRPNEYHKQFEGKPSTYKKLKDVSDSPSADKSDKYKDKRHKNKQPALDTNYFDVSDTEPVKSLMREI